MSTGYWDDTTGLYVTCVNDSSVEQADIAGAAPSAYGLATPQYTQYTQSVCSSNELVDPTSYRSLEPSVGQYRPTLESLEGQMSGLDPYGRSLTGEYQQQMYNNDQASHDPQYSTSPQATGQQSQEIHRKSHKTSRASGGGSQAALRPAMTASSSSRGFTPKSILSKGSKVSKAMEPSGHSRMSGKSNKGIQFTGRWTANWVTPPTPDPNENMPGYSRAKNGPKRNYWIEDGEIMALDEEAVPKSLKEKELVWIRCHNMKANTTVKADRWRFADGSQMQSYDGFGPAHSGAYKWYWSCDGRLLPYSTGIPLDWDGQVLVRPPRYLE